MSNLADVIGDHDAFLTTIFGKIAAAGFDPADFSQCDHLCYRTSTNEQYLQKKQALQPFGTQIGEAMVNGRQITTFRLHEPLHYKEWRIDALELPAPKPDVATREGLDHVELVLYDDMKTFLTKHAGKEFNLVSVDRGINPEVGYALGDGLVVKFHLLSLTTVVYLERKLGITEVSS